ncbi:MAG: hypothetical protein ABSG23_17525 [Terriglobales bacterium]|jgi:hypothetical protein
MVNVVNIVNGKQTSIFQVHGMLPHKGVEACKKAGPKFMQRLVAKQKARAKDS